MGQQQTRSIYVDEPLTAADKAAAYEDTPIAPPRARTWTDTAVDALPMVGGAAGGILGAPAGPLGSVGLASLLGAGGEAWRQNINRMRGVNAPATPTEAAKDIALEGGTQGAMEAGGALATKALSAGGRAVYRGYLKPSLSRVNLPKAAQIVETAIKENLPVTAGGAAKAQELIGALKAKVDTLLQQAPGRTVDLSEIADGVRTWAKRMYDRPGRDPRDYEAALKVADRIDQHPSIQNPFAPQSPAQAGLPGANQIKRDLQGAARDKFGMPGGTAETQTEKYASSQMRRGIEKQADAAGLQDAAGNGVGALNARESRLLDAARSISQAIGREANQSKLHGVKTLAAGVVGAEDYRRTGDAKGAAARALAVRLGMEPAVATQAAIIAARMGDAIPSAALADVARVAVKVASEAGNSQEER